jgi:pimeloyl-ACP methyl ester carboxylesterase
MTTSMSTAGTLDVPGARLHYTVSGSGPLLLMIPGGAGDSGMFAALAPSLATDRAVVTYDPRGLSASTVTDPSAEITVATQADDARRLIEAFGGHGDVLGASGGALTAFDLVARNPGMVGTLVAHEPPLTYLLPESPDGAVDEGIMDVYRRDGAGPAMMAFLAHIGVFGDQPLPPLEAMAPMVPNFDVFFGRMWASIGAFRPDVEALRRSSTRIVVATGEAAHGQMAERAAAEFARLLGGAPVGMPGDHGGFMNEPVAFAAALRQIFAG